MGDKNFGKRGFGSRPRALDDKYRAMAKGVPRKRVWTKEKCVEELEDCLTLFKKILRDDEKLNKGNPIKLKAESIRDLNNMQNRMLQFMQYLYPVVQKSVNLNIDVTADAVIERLKNWKKKKIIDVKMKEVEVVKDENKQ